MILMANQWRGVVSGLIFKFGIIIALCLLVASVSAAESPTSPNYRFDETSIGTGGFLEGSSS